MVAAVATPSSAAIRERAKGMHRKGWGKQQIAFKSHTHGSSRLPSQKWQSQQHDFETKILMVCDQITAALDQE
jgi:hypothetical protein